MAGPRRPPPSSTRIPAWREPRRTSLPSLVFPTFARRVASETPTLSLSCDEPLILTEPPGPCGAGRFCRLLRRWCSVQLSQGSGLDCLWPHGCSGRRRARPPARLGVLTSFGAAPRSPPVPSGPSGALHAGGAWRAGVWTGASFRSPPVRSGALRRPPHQWGRVAVVWFGASSRCPARPRHRPRAPQPGPVDQVGRLSETGIAFACWYLCGSETGIAFAGAKWAYLVHFSGAVVMSVSAVPCWG